MSFFLALLALYVLMVAYVAVMQRSFFYFPTVTRPDMAAAGVAGKMDVVSVRTQDGLDIEGWYAPPEAGKPVILMFHGNGGAIDMRGFKAMEFIPDGYGVLLGEYRSYGGNPGKPSEKGFYDDARAYISFLTKEKNIPIQDIVLYGESLGTGVAVLMAIENSEVKALVLETPYTTLPDVAQRHMFYVPVKLFMRDRYDSLSRIAKVKSPILFLHGTADYIVPYEQGKKLYDTAITPKIMQTFPGGGHNNLYSLGAGQRIREFLSAL